MIQEMTVQECLNQLKILRDRIAVATQQSFVGVATAKGTVTSTGQTAAVFGERAAANLQSAAALIRNYRAIKRAINLSNARTEITVGGQRMTVAEAIDWKTSITFVETLRNKLTMDLTASQRVVAAQEDKVLRDAEQAAQVNFGPKENANAKEYEAAVEAYIRRNGMVLIDAVNAQKVIDDMTAQIDSFNAEIDLALTVSNVSTRLVVDWE